jgi:hypothetical protein
MFKKIIFKMVIKISSLTAACQPPHPTAKSASSLVLVCKKIIRNNLLITFALLQARFFMTIIGVNKNFLK